MSGILLIFLLCFSTKLLFSADRILENCQQHKAPILHLLSSYETIDETTRQDILESLLKNNANLNAQDLFYGATPIAYAAGHKSPALVVFLLAAGADLTIKNEQGEDALLYATRQICDRKASCENLTELLQAGARPSIPSRDGETALSRAQLAGRQDIVDLFNSRPRE